MRLDLPLLDVDPGTRVHRDVHLPGPAKDEHPLPGLLQRPGSADRRALLTSPIGVSRSVGQVILQHGIRIDEHLVCGTAPAERTRLHCQPSFHDLGSTRVIHVRGHDRQCPRSLLGQGQRPARPPVAHEPVVGRVQALVHRQSATGSDHPAHRSIFSVLNDRPVRIRPRHRQIPNLLIVSIQHHVRPPVRDVKGHINVRSQLVLGSHLQEGEVSSAGHGTASVISQHHGPASSV